MIITDRVVYGPDDKPAAALQGFLAEAAHRVPTDGRDWRFVLPCRLPAYAAPSNNEAPLDTSWFITLRRRIRQRVDRPDVDFEVFSFADKGSVDAYQAWLKTEKEARR